MTLAYVWSMNLYPSAAAMRHLESWQSSVAQDLGATGKTAYKSIKTGLERPDPSNYQGREIPLRSVTSQDFTTANARKTGRNLDVAFNDDGFIIAMDADQTPVLTRDGTLQISPDGRLVTSSGFLIDGLDGPIQISATEADPNVDEFGEVWQGTQSVGRIRAVTVSDQKALMTTGAGWRLPEDGSVAMTDIPPDKSKFKVGYLEESNISPMKSMITLMQISRLFEANEKAIHTLDDVVNQTIRNAR